MAANGGLQAPFDPFDKLRASRLSGTLADPPRRTRQPEGQPKIKFPISTGCLPAV